MLPNRGEQLAEPPQVVWRSRGNSVRRAQVFRSRNAGLLKATEASEQFARFALAQSLRACCQLCSARATAAQLLAGMAEASQGLALLDPDRKRGADRIAQHDSKGREPKLSVRGSARCRRHRPEQAQQGR